VCPSTWKCTFISLKKFKEKAIFLEKIKIFRQDVSGLAEIKDILSNVPAREY
jgi:hypothetical protein